MVKPFDPSWKQFHVSSKAGPNGQAMDSCLIDLLNLPSDLREDIYLLGGPELEKRKKSQLGLGPEVLRSLHRGKLKPVEGIRKLSIVKDPEAKARIIGIIDYWSQCALYGTWEETKSLLKTFQSDCTFNQGSRLHLLKPNSNFHSIDLKNATDRFPKEFQYEVLSYLIGEEKARA